MSTTGRGGILRTDEKLLNVNDNREEWGILHVANSAVSLCT